MPSPGVFVDRPLSDEEAARIFDTGVIHDNIRVNGTDVGGLTLAQAKAKVEKSKNGSPATFRAHELNWTAGNGS